MGRIYVDAYFPEEYKNRIAEMVENIKATYADSDSFADLDV